MTPSNIISWLMEGDTSIQYQTHRDLLGNEKPSLRKKIALEGWGFRLMSQRNQQGSWGQDYYQPKWICTHYTLLDLKNLQIDPKNKTIRDILDKVFLNEKGPDGGILPIGGVKKSDVCVNGMALNFASYFGQNQNDLISVIDFNVATYCSVGFIFLDWPLTKPIFNKASTAIKNLICIIFIFSN